ncbi:ADP-ribosylation factor-like protein 16 isoform X2 [Phyllobates terribilis]|uniref:ADP-ribosylation factor-like protein 16 isoform X2 n=1 Tax=Phyllobates terribilis TaxID=111132 RepID=UPI003CCACB1C
MCLVLGPSGVGKTLLMKRLQKLCGKESTELGDVPPTQPTFVVDAANPNQVSASCVQLLSMLSAPALSAVSVLVVFNKTDLPCCMSLVEMKSLFRLDDVIACAKQPITVLETSALEGTGLLEVLQWLNSSASH